MFLIGKLTAGLGRSSSASWYVVASTGVVAAIVAVTSLLTWWPYDRDKPISHPTEAIERLLLPQETLEQMDSRVASLLGVDKEAVGFVRRGLLEVASGAASPQLGERLYKMVPTTTEPVSSSDGNSSDLAAFVPGPLPTSSSNTATPAPAEELSQEATGGSPAPTTTGEPSPSSPMNTTSPPAATEDAPSAPPVTEAPPTTSEPPSSPPSLGGSLPQEDSSPTLPVGEPLTGSPPPPPAVETPTSSSS